VQHATRTETQLNSL